MQHIGQIIVESALKNLVSKTGFVLSSDEGEPEYKKTFTAKLAVSPKIGPQDKKTLSQYIQASDNFGELNVYLRTRNPSVMTEPKPVPSFMARAFDERGDHYEQMATDMDRAIQRRAIYSKKPMIVYRGIHDMHRNDLTRGGIEPGFLSTTLHKGVAAWHAVPESHFHMPGNTKLRQGIYRIHVPAGIPHLVTPENSQYSMEHEVLFPRNLHVSDIKATKFIAVHPDRSSVDRHAKPIIVPIHDVHLSLPEHHPMNRSKR